MPTRSHAQVKLPLEPPYLDEALTSSEPVLSLVKGALRSRRLELDTFSYVMSMAGAPAQHWHTDVDPLFSEWRGEEIPPHGIVAAVALGAITKASCLPSRPPPAPPTVCPLSDLHQSVC